MTHPALKCLRQYYPQLTVQPGGQTAKYVYCEDEDVVVAIGVSPVPMAAGMSVKVQLTRPSIEHQLSQEYLRQLEFALEEHNVHVTQAPPYTVVLGLTLPDVLRKSGHFIPERMKVFLTECNDLLNVMQLVYGVVDYCAKKGCTEENTVARWVELTMLGVKENVTVH